MAADAIDTLLAERDAAHAAGRKEALEEAARLVFEGNQHPGFAYDEYGDMVADTSERHAENVLRHALWNAASEIRALQHTGDTPND